MLKNALNHVLILNGFTRDTKILMFLFINFFLQVFDDIAVELTMAILQFLNSKPKEEHLFRSMKALSKFVFVSVIEIGVWKAWCF